MPELPEVETIRLTLESKLIGRTIHSAIVLHDKMIYHLPVAEFLSRIQNQPIHNLTRRGKYLLMELSNHLFLALHLRMTGQLTVTDSKEPDADALRFKLLLDNGTELRFRDQRKFGMVFLFSDEEIPTSISLLGPEPLAPDFTVAVLKKQFSRRKLAVKKALLDQRIIAGIGNIYADEALFVAGIHPARLVDSLTQPELEKLHCAIGQVLGEGLQYRGTTKRDYRDGEGKAGSYQEHLRVYGRNGLLCVQCNAPIAKMQFGGRGTHFCPLCQS